MNDEIEIIQEEDNLLQNEEIVLLNEEDFALSSWAFQGFGLVGIASLISLGLGVVLALIKRSNSI